MPELAKFSLEGGGSVHIDVDDVPRVAPVSRHGRILDAKATFEAALGDVRDAAVVALTEFRAMARQPDEVEITFDVRLDAEVGAVIAKTGMGETLRSSSPGGRMSGIRLTRQPACPKPPSYNDPIQFRNR